MTQKEKIRSHSDVLQRLARELEPFPDYNPDDVWKRVIAPLLPAHSLPLDFLEELVASKPRGKSCQLILMLAEMGRREIIPIARRELEVHDEDQIFYAQALASLGETEGLEAMERIFHESRKNPDEPSSIPPGTVIDALRDVGTPGAIEIAERLRNFE